MFSLPTMGLRTRSPSKTKSSGRASSCSAVSAVGGLPPMSSTASPRTPAAPSALKPPKNPKASFAARMSLAWSARGKKQDLEGGAEDQLSSRSTSECSTRADSEASSDSDPGSPVLSRLQDFAHSASKSPTCGGSSVFIFDWDDTLLPTTAIRATRSPQRHSPPPLNPFELGAHAELVESTLRAARAVGHVSIVTLSKNNWVPRSAEKYLPGLDMPELIKELGITVYYAQDEEQSCPGAIAAEDWGALKRASMSRCLDDWRFSEYTLAEPEPELNVISIGDSEAEKAALKAVLGAKTIDRPLCKTVKLMDEPTLEELSRQLEGLPCWFRRMARANKSFDLCIDRPSVIAARARSLGL